MGAGRQHGLSAGVAHALNSLLIIIVLLNNFSDYEIQ